MNRVEYLFWPLGGSNEQRHAMDQMFGNLRLKVGFYSLSTKSMCFVCCFSEIWTRFSPFDKAKNEKVAL